MQTPQSVEHHAPGRGESLLFYIKSRLLMADRWWKEFGQRPPQHPRRERWIDAPLAAEMRAPLWTQISPAEFPLTAGKVQNLRAACHALDGIEVNAGEVFSFWRQLGRTTRGKGFTAGRELRSGCLVPNLGGGLCQLSGLLHAAALQAGLEVVEHHPHSRTLPGAPVPPDRDATIFWNYVDLRFRSTYGWRLETRLSATELIVAIRAQTAPEPPSRPSRLNATGTGLPVRAAAEGDCLTCGVVTCFRHPAATRDHSPAQGHTAWLLEGKWPEFNSWCARHTRAGDRWLTPLDGRRWKKPNYAWTPPPGTHTQHATLTTLWRSLRLRRLPAQGAVRQRFLIESQRRLAAEFARRLDPQARHLVISQTLLPHLWLAGHLGGRTFDVLANRWPLAELQARLDEAARRHPTSETLVDFRADPAWITAENRALAAAARIVTPHRAIAAHFGSRALLLDWDLPPNSPRRAVVMDSPAWFLPTSALARKGIYEIAAAMTGAGGECWILGRAREGNGEPLSSLPYRAATVEDLDRCTALVLPAWVEHEPRLALQALSRGIPVIASRECGLPPHPLLIEVEAGNSAELRAKMTKIACDSLQAVG